MKSQWECVLENLGEWVGSFTTVTPHGTLIEDIPSVIKLVGIRDNQTVQLVLNRFYPLPNSTERYAKEVVWNFSTPPGIGAVYFETGAFSSGPLTVNIGVKTIAEFCLIAGDRRWRMIQTFDMSQQLDRLTFVREHRQATTAPERPHLEIADLLGTWHGPATTLFADGRSTVTVDTESTFTVRDCGYQLVESDHSIDLTIDHTIADSKLLRLIDRHQTQQLLLLPDGGYTITPAKIEPGQAFRLEIGWLYQTGQRQRLVRQYDSAGKWESATLAIEQLL